MIDIALGILTEESSDGEDSQPPSARRFAIEILKLRSGVKMDIKVWEDWIESKTPLPQSTYRVTAAPKVTLSSPNIDAGVLKAVTDRIRAIVLGSGPIDLASAA